MRTFIHSYWSFLVTVGFSIGIFHASSAVAFSQENKEKFTIQSSAFTENGFIPTKYTCNGDNISPPLNWKEIPTKTKSLVLIVDDPDAPNGIWNHWIIFNIPIIAKLPENLSSLPEGAKYGNNSWGKLGYGGPCPPSGIHRYFFKLYAIDILLNLQEGASRVEVEKAMQGHVLAMTTLIGIYKK